MDLYRFVELIVPCYRRTLEMEKETDDRADFDDIVFETVAESSELPDDAVADSGAWAAPKNQYASTANNESMPLASHEEEDIPDMDDLMDDDDELAVKPVVPEDQVSAGKPAKSNIANFRTYDIYITYDKYYQTPRMWLYGYDEVT